jgi:tol-pal system protein YbgF
MRRIKTYVVTVGVALCVAPIFNSAIAQQSNSSTELLLQVQSMRQEIAELRDMVERQQFQLKRLQKQTDSQSKQLELAQSYGDSPRNDGYPSAYTEPTPPAHDTLPVQTANSVAQAGIGSAPIFNNNGAQPIASQQVALGSPIAQAEVEAQFTTAATQGFTQPATGAATANFDPAADQTLVTQTQNASLGTTEASYPPVVDRSFRTSVPVVPITGAGSAQQSVSLNQQADASMQTSISNSEVVYSAVAVANTAAQQAVLNQRPADQIDPAQLESSASNGVVSIPPQVEAQLNASQVLPVQITAAQVVAAQGGSASLTQTQQITGQQITGQPISGQVTQGQIATSQAPNVSVVLENDFYAQGFDLLKQSKYEEAAAIFEQQLQAYPKGDLADDAHYWIAEAMHVSRKLDVAKVHLRAIISDHPQSARLPDAMLKTAYIEQSQGNQIEARILFQEIVNLHPQSDAAIAAKNRLAAVN